MVFTGTGDKILISPKSFQYSKVNKMAGGNIKNMINLFQFDLIIYFYLNV